MLHRFFEAYELAVPETKANEAQFPGHLKATLELNPNCLKENGWLKYDELKDLCESKELDKDEILTFKRSRHEGKAKPSWETPLSEKRPNERTIKIYEECIANKFFWAVFSLDFGFARDSENGDVEWLQTAINRGWNVMDIVYTRFIFLKRMRKYRRIHRPFSFTTMMLTKAMWYTVFKRYYD